MENIRNAYRILGKRPLLRLRPIRKDNSKMNLTKVDWTHEDRIQSKALVNTTQKECYLLGYDAVYVYSVDIQQKFRHLLSRSFLVRLILRP
jgi:hypothetical protein